MRTLSLLLLCIGLLLKANGQVGNLDSSFGANGLRIMNLKGNVLHEEGRKVLPLVNGDFFVVFNTRTDEDPRTSDSEAGIAKYHSNGTLDGSYGNNGFSISVNKGGFIGAVFQENKIIAAGSNGNVILVRYNADGSLDSSFGEDGILMTDLGEAEYTRSVTTQGNKIVVLGYTNYNNFFIIRYNYDGSLDSTFSEDGIVLTDYNLILGRSLAIQGEKMVVAGQDYNLNSGNVDFTLIRYNSDGSFDSTFGENGKAYADFVYDDIPQSIVIQGDKIVVAGYSIVNSGSLNFAVARYNSDGSLDTTFSKDGKQITNFGTFDVAQSIAVQEDKIVVAGYAYNPNTSNYDFAIARYNTDGSLDQSFNEDGKFTSDFSSNDFVSSVTIQTGKIVVTGRADNSMSNNGDFAVARYNDNGLLDNSFAANGLLLDYFPSGELLLAGTATQKDGKIIAVGSAGTVVEVIVGSVGTVDLIATSGSFALVRFNKDGSLDPTFSEDGKQTTDFGPDALAQDVAIQEDGKIVVAGYTQLFDDTYSEFKFAIARYNQDGSLDTTFSEDGKQTFIYFDQAQANAVAIQADGKIVVAGSYFDYGYALVRYNTDGSFDSTFSGDGIQTSEFFENASPPAVAILANGKIVLAGSAYSLSGTKDFIVVRYNADGSPDSTFSEDGIQTTDVGLRTDVARSVAIQADGKIVVAGSSSEGEIYNGTYTSNFALARYSMNGSLDSTFSEDGVQTIDFGQNETATSVIIQGNKIIVGGNDGNRNFLIVRLNTEGSLDSSFNDDGKQITDVGGADFLTQLALSRNQLYAVGGTSTAESVGVVAAYQLEQTVVLSCPENKVVSTDKGVCSTVVNGIDPVLSPADSATTVSYTLTGATKGSGTGSVSGKIFNKGVTTVTYNLHEDVSQSCFFTVKVADKEAPQIRYAYAFPFILWPVDRQMKAVTVNYTLSDNCSGTTASLSVLSSEPESGVGAGDLSPDWQVLDAHHVLLRAEGYGTGFGGLYPYIGRIYTILITATDKAGNKSTRNVKVVVPAAWLNNNAGDKTDKKDIVVEAMPNPSNSSFTLVLQSGSDEPVSLRVTNALGSVMEVRTNLKANANIRLGGSYSAGVYVAEVVQGNKRNVVKLIKLPQ